MVQNRGMVFEEWLFINIDSELFAIAPQDSYYRHTNTVDANNVVQFRWKGNIEPFKWGMAGK